MLHNTMTDSLVTLFCLVDGEITSCALSVEIDETRTGYLSSLKTTVWCAFAHYPMYAYCFFKFLVCDFRPFLIQ